MRRRDVIKAGLGSIGIGGTVLGATGILSAPALAASSNISITDSGLTNDDGDASRVSVTLNHTVTWNGFDVPVEAVAWRDRIQRLDDSGAVTAEATVYDNTSGQRGPVLLSNVADGSWGGSNENSSGPGTNGSVSAGIDWVVLMEPDGDGLDRSDGNSVEVPGNIDEFGLDNPTDGTTKDATLEYVKEVFFYTGDSTGGYTSQDGSTTLRLLGDDDGTLTSVVGSDTFTVSVSNEAATASNSGTGSSSVS